MTAYTNDSIEHFERCHVLARLSAEVRRRRINAVAVPGPFNVGLFVTRINGAYHQALQDDGVKHAAGIDAELGKLVHNFATLVELHVHTRLPQGPPDALVTGSPSPI